MNPLIRLGPRESVGPNPTNRRMSNPLPTLPLTTAVKGTVGE